jgi:hypothetical protein
MATSAIRLSKSPNLHDLIQKFYTLVENLKQNHENDIKILNRRIQDLKSENDRLRTIHEQHPHSIFDINYVSNDSITIEQLQSELKKSRDQVDLLQRSLNEQYTTCEDIRSKYSLQLLMNQNHTEQQNSNPSDSNKIKEFESKFQQIKDQIHQFDQCNYESDEQIRLLKQLVFNNDPEQSKTINQSLTVKQADLFQQTDIVENILNKQQTKILEKLTKLLEENPQQTTSKTKKTKKKRL